MTSCAFIGYLAAQITPEAFEALRLTANEQGVVFPSSCQDGAYRIVIKDRCAKLVHPGATVDTTLQFAYHEPTPIDFYTGFTTLEWLCTYAGGHHFRAVTVQDASSQQHSTALWFDVPRAYAEDLLAKGPHHVAVGSWTATIRWPQTLSELGKKKNITGNARPTLGTFQTTPRSSVWFTRPCCDCPRPR